MKGKHKALLMTFGVAGIIGALISVINGFSVYAGSLSGLSIVSGSAEGPTSIEVSAQIGIFDFNYIQTLGILVWICFVIMAVVLLLVFKKQ